MKSVTLRTSLPELALLAVLLLCALYDLTLYTSTHLSARNIQLTPAQKRLLGVSSTGECALQHCIPTFSCCSLDDMRPPFVCMFMEERPIGVGRQFSLLERG